MSLIYLVEITAATDAAGTTTTLRYSTGTGYAHPTAAGYYEARVVQPANLRRTLFGSGTTSGAIEQGYGELLLANIDGALDAIADYGLDGRACRILMGDDQNAYSSFVEMLNATMESASFALGEISIRLRDRLSSLEAKAATPNKYLGNNALPAGLEGGADLAGRPKPKIFGKVLNISPVLVNSSRLIFQLSDSALASVEGVYDAGAALTAGAAYTSQTDMETTAPTAGQYRVWLAGGYVRLGASPAGQITADATEGSTTAARSAGQIMYRIATTLGGVATGGTTASDATALLAKSGAITGLYLEEGSVREAMEQIASAAGAWFGFDRTGTLRMGRLEVPALPSVYTFRRIVRGAVMSFFTADILEIEKLITEDEGRGIPARSVVISHSRNYTVQASGVAGSVSADRRSWLSAEYRSAVSSNASTALKYLTAPELSFSTLLTTAADAGTEAARRLTLYGTRRDRLRLRTPLTAELVGLADLGAICTVEYPRWGLAAGKLMVITGFDYDAQANFAELELWG